jgi:hypothetical protein
MLQVEARGSAQEGKNVASCGFCRDPPGSCMEDQAGRWVPRGG